MKYLYIRMNPKKFNQGEYNNFVRKFPSNECSFLIDFVHDVELYDIKEITPFEFDKKQKERNYG